MAFAQGPLPRDHVHARVSAQLSLEQSSSVPPSSLSSSTTSLPLTHPGASNSGSSATSATHEDHLASALDDALRSLASHTGAAESVLRPEQDMQFVPFRDKERANLDIVVSSDHLVLKGTGVDVEPATLTGQVVLCLAERMSFKAITLVFKGKARVPVNPNDPHVLNNSYSVFSVCKHEWSFLEGEKHHPHTLKPGRHVFPFELRIGGSVPSTILTQAHGGASITYKLRATAVRPGFVASNLHASLPLRLTRSFAREALEYQQSLEIENTWPDKIMYSLVLPHKAWAAGDSLAVLVKFAPMAKGVRVQSVTTSVCETTRTLTKGGDHLEATRTVAQRRHDIVHGKAVCVDDLRQRQIEQMIHDAVTSSAAHTQSMMGGSLAPFMLPRSVTTGMSNAGFFLAGPSVSRALHEVAEHPETSSSSPTEFPSNLSPRSGEPSSSASATSDPHTPDPSENADVVATLTLHLPETLTPSHSLDPIVVSYRVRWSVMIGNADGHTSELRCSLPLYVLDATHRDSARAASRVTRRLLLGPAFTLSPDGSAEDEELFGDEEEEEVELPSYPSHVRDRVANAYLPDAATVRVANPWLFGRVDSNANVLGVGSGSSSTRLSSSASTSALPSLSASSSSSRPGSSNGLGSRLRAHLPNAHSHSSQSLQSQYTQAPTHFAVDVDSGASTPAALEWASSPLELALSTGEGGMRAPGAPRVQVLEPDDSERSSRTARSTPSHSQAQSRIASRTGSRWGSRAQSRVASRAASPERGESSAVAAGAPSVSSSTTAPAPTARSDSTYVHEGGPASRQAHGVFAAALRPLTSITSPWSSPHSHVLGYGHGHGHGHASAHVHGLTSANQSLAVGSISALTHGAGAVSASTPGTPPRASPGRSPTSLPVDSDPSAFSTPLDPATGAALLRHVLTAVPDYAASARGFLGGGAPPLESLHGLPSYDETVAASSATRRAGRARA